VDLARDAAGVEAAKLIVRRVEASLDQYCTNERVEHYCQKEVNSLLRICVDGRLNEQR